jgi:hypothetical protein
MRVFLGFLLGSKTERINKILFQLQVFLFVDIEYTIMQESLDHIRT